MYSTLLPEGMEVPDVGDQETIKTRLRKQNCVPVFLEDELIRCYYTGFCNTILWPLFHYMQPSIETIQASDHLYFAYIEANKRFARVVMDNYQPGDIVWYR